MKIKVDLQEIELDEEQILEFDNRVAPLIEGWKQRNLASHGDKFSLLELCRDCYMQGLLDGSNQEVLAEVERQRNEQEK